MELNWNYFNLCDPSDLWKSGKAYSFLADEQKTWVEHTLVYDEEVRNANLSLLDSFTDGRDIYLSFVERSWGGLPFQHWFVTDLRCSLEFGSAHEDIYRARVTINTFIQHNYPYFSKDTKFCKKMDKQMRDRMRHVLGMCNYSLCLRNCEHIANYVFHGYWISNQMKDQGDLMSYFCKCKLHNRIHIVNSFPANIHPQTFGEEKSEKLYSFLNDNYTFSSFDYFLDDKQNTYNVLVVGPTGAGKSHLINVFFNQKICDADVSHRSITNDIYFVRGRGQVYNSQKKIYEERNIVVADTIGLCDTEWDDKLVTKLIQSRVSSNIKYIDAVFVVFRADRLLKEHVDNIKMILKWLKYSAGDNSLRFWFVGTYAENISDEKKASLREEATAMLGLSDTKRKNLETGDIFQSLVYTGFPPEDTLNDKTKQKVEESWKNLKPFLKLPGDSKKIRIDREMSCSIV